MYTKKYFTDFTYHTQPKKVNRILENGWQMKGIYIYIIVILSKHCRGTNAQQRLAQYIAIGICQLSKQLL